MEEYLERGCFFLLQAVEGRNVFGYVLTFEGDIFCGGSSGLGGQVLGWYLRCRLGRYFEEGGFSLGNKLPEEEFFFWRRGFGLGNRGSSFWEACC